MKLYKCNLIKIILWVGILLVTGCSANTANMPSISSTYNPTMTHVSGSYTGKIAYIYSTNDFGYYYHIVIMNANGSEIRDITPPNLPLISGLALSRNGEYIAFEASIEDKTQIFTMRTDGKDLQQLTFREENAYRPSWSQDGKHIIFLSKQNDMLDYRGNPAIQGYITKSDGTELQRLQDDHKLSVNNVAYRGENLISISVPATPNKIRAYTIDLNGVIQKQFPEFTIDGIPIWSHDGKLVVFGSSRTDCSGIIIMQPDGSNQVCLIAGKISQAYNPFWSPDGKHIIFSSDLDGDHDLYIVNTDGAGLIQLTNFPGNEGEAVWSP